MSMLNYIKKEISTRETVVTESAKFTDDNVAPENIPDDIVLEYSQLFQELDELSVEGTDADRERKMGVDIPLDINLDDSEITNIEYNLKDGRITDIPSDAAVMESYKGIKTYESFVQEAYDALTPFTRESSSSFANRVKKLADKNYNEYCENTALSNKYGSETINIGSSIVPSKVNVNLGSIDNENSGSMFMKLDVLFGTDKDHNITQKQLDSVNLVRNGALSNIGAAVLESVMGETDGTVNAWDVATPTKLYVPTGSRDSFCVVLEFMNELTHKLDYVGWTKPTYVQEDVEPIQTETDLNDLDNSTADLNTGGVNQGGTGANMPDTINDVSSDDTITESDINALEKVNMESFMTDRFENHDVYLEAAALYEEKKSKRSFSRFYQEAIDFGDSGDAGDAGSDLPPAEGEGDTIDDTSDDTNTANDTNDTGSTDDTTDDGEKEQAAVNDVSKDIAQKVADNTSDDMNNNNSNNDEDFNNTEVTFDEDSADNVNDVSTDENNEDVNDQLDDLDNSVNNDEDMSDEGSTDDEFENMSEDENIDINDLTMDQIIDRGSEKLKNMSINQIKDFLSSGSEESVQEAFFITSKTVNKEVDVALRQCLGILNDNQKNIEQIAKEFRKVGHKLNRVLSKASRMKKVYSTDEISSIQTLNKSLADLLTKIKKVKDVAYKDSIKNAISAFTSNAKAVSSFVEDKLNAKTVQEFAQESALIQESVFLSESNAKHRFVKKARPVYLDLKDILRAHENGRLTRGKLLKMYKPKVAIGSAESKTSTYHSDNRNMTYLDNLMKITTKIMRRDKVQEAFSKDELAKIDQLNEDLYDLIDLIEAIVLDDVNVTPSELIGSVVNLSEKIINAIEFVASSSGEVLDNSKPGHIKEKKFSETEDNSDMIDNEDNIETDPDIDNSDSTEPNTKSNDEIEDEDTGDDNDTDTTEDDDSLDETDDDDNDDDNDDETVEESFSFNGFSRF